MRKLKLDELGRLSADQFKSSDKSPIVVVLDNIRSAHNVGSIFRTADGFGVSKLILTGITARPPHREIHKTAIGATESMPWDYSEDTVDAIKELEKEGYTILIAEQTTASVPLQSVELAEGQKVAIVLGNEVDGVTDEVVEHVGSSVEIPQFGTKHSFNVAVSAGILLWELTRRIKPL